MDEVQKLRESPAVAALAPFGFKVEESADAGVMLVSVDLAKRCTVEVVVHGPNDWPPEQLTDLCDVRVVVYTHEEVDDCFPFSGTVAELVQWMGR